MSFFEEFDDETKLKLSLLEEYLKAFIPISLKDKRINQVYIFDLFCGPGEDENGVPGSPIIILETLKKIYEEKEEWFNGKYIHLFFNDKNPKHIENLKKKIANYSKLNFSIKTTTLDFNDFITEHEMYLKTTNILKLVFLDQFGVKYIVPETLYELLSVGKTDIMSFFSTSFINRFKDKIGEEILGINTKIIEAWEKTKLHREFAGYLKDKLRDKSRRSEKIYFAPFSIKKGANIYGLIFACSNLRPLEKFLSVCWKIDKRNGEANYNIEKDENYDDGKGQQLSFWQEPLKKIDEFKNSLFDFIEKKKRTNKEIYVFALENGFPPNQMKEIVDDLKECGLVIEKTDGKRARSNARYLGYNWYKKEEEAYYFIEDKNG